MTAVGCVAAWGLHCAGLRRTAPPWSRLLLGAVFFAAYFRTGSYAWMTFFVTVYVVFLFALLGQPTLPLMIIRGFQTLIGCAVAHGGVADRPDGPLAATGGPLRGRPVAGVRGFSRCDLPATAGRRGRRGVARPGGGGIAAEAVRFAGPARGGRL